MKGLLLKEGYTMFRYCRLYLILLAVVLSLIVVTGEAGGTFILYPGFFAGFMPVTLVSYDERDRWMAYSQTIPVCRSQLVTVKYIIGFLIVFVVTAVMVLAMGLKSVIMGVPMSAQVLSQVSLLWMTGLVMPTLVLPCVFWLGVEKGRIFYMLFIVAVSASVALLTTVDSFQYHVPGWLVRIPLLVIVVCYLLSWRLSIFCFQRREIA